MTELRVTWRHAARLYWAFFWRGIVFLMLPLAMAGFFFGIFMAGNDIPPEKHLWKLQVVLFPVSLLISIWIIKDILTSSMGSFRIVLVSTESQAQPAVQAEGPASGGSAA